MMVSRCCATGRGFPGFSFVVQIVILRLCTESRTHLIQEEGDEWRTVSASIQGILKECDAELHAALCTVRTSDSK